MLLKETDLRWPTDGDINGWADYAELLCMLHIDGELSLQSFADWINDNVDKTPAQKLRAVHFTEEYLKTAVTVTPLPLTPFLPNAVDEEEKDEGYEEDDKITFTEAPDSDPPDTDIIDALSQRLRDVWVVLEARQRNFAGHYPFAVENSVLRFKAATQTAHQQLYIVLMCSSQMQVFSPSAINKLGHCFEALCQIPFRKLLPAGATIRFFGAGAGSLLPATMRYAGKNLRERLKALATDLAVDTQKALEDEDEVSSGGDASLDWVAFLSFKDDVPHQPVFFAQCACGANWIDKQHEARFGRWQRFLHVRQSIQYIHFVPRSFRRLNAAWHRASSIMDDLVLIDRYRLLFLLEGEAQATLQDLLTPYAALLAQKGTISF